MRVNNIVIKNFLIQKPALNIFLASLVALVLLSTFCLSLNVIDNQRFIQFVQSMFHTGITPFPMVGGNPYPDYLATATILSYWCSLPFGKPTVFSITLPYCLAGALISFFTYKLAALKNKQWGFYAVLFLFAAWKFSDGISSLALDIFPAFITVLGVYLVFAATQSKRYRYLYWLVPAWVFGFMIRGPIGVIVPAIIVLCYLLLQQDWRRCFIFSAIALLIVIAGFFVMLTAARHVGGMSFYHQVLQEEAFGRIHNQHSSRYYFYFTLGLLNYLITSLFAVAVLWLKRKAFFSSHQAGLQKNLAFIAVWFVLPILLFTIPNTKEARYIMPALPAMALLAAYIFVEQHAAFEKLRRFLARLALVLPALSIIFIAAELIYQKSSHAAVPAHFVWGLLFCVLLLCVAWHFARSYIQTHAYYSLVMLLIIANIVGLNALILSPVSLHNDYKNGVQLEITRV